MEKEYPAISPAAWLQPSGSRPLMVVDPEFGGGADGFDELDEPPQPHTASRATITNFGNALLNKSVSRKELYDFLLA